MDPAAAFELEFFQRQKPIQDAILSGQSDIQKFYKDASVFITGGTGFLGKQLIEKLLRSCDIKKIYFLIRAKKGKKIEERLTKILTEPVFNLLREQKPNFEQKLVPMEGDVAELRLGLSDQDRATLCEQVDFIYHVAATTKFDEPLKIASAINLRGTREMINLARDFKKLKSFVHVSTAYSHATYERIENVVDEEFYPCTIKPEVIITMAEEMDSNTLDDITPRLIQPWPNTYTFAKALAEELVKNATDLPICIVRPAIVVAAYYEPAPGWLDKNTIFGLNAILVGPGVGLTHVILGDYKAKSSLVPVDFVNNSIIAAGYITACHTSVTPKIYALSSVSRNIITLGQVMTRTLDFINKMPTPKALWDVYLVVTSNLTLFTLLTWFLNYIPGWVMDFLLILTGKKARFTDINLKMYKKSKTLSYFSSKTWYFKDKNTEEMFNNLSETDKIMFNFDVASIHWPEYITIWCIGVRKYLLEDNLSDTKYAMRKRYCFKIANCIFLSILFYFVYKLSSLLYILFLI